MKSSRRLGALAVLGAAIVSPVSTQSPRRVTVDDVMALRTVNDVKISPAGDRVAYVVSTPSVVRNAHEAELYVIPSAGGTPVRVAPEARIFVPALPAPRLRWSPDGERLSFLGLVDGRPQVMTVPASGGAAKPLTAAAEGVSAYEISPDGTALAFLSRDGSPPRQLPMPPARCRRSRGSGCSRWPTRRPPSR